MGGNPRCGQMANLGSILDSDPPTALSRGPGTMARGAEGRKCSVGVHPTLCVKWLWSLTSLADKRIKAQSCLLVRKMLRTLPYSKEMSQMTRGTHYPETVSHIPGEDCQ